MSVRDAESRLVARCAAAARHAQAAQNQCEANVFYLAALLVQPRFPLEAQRLMGASEQYFLAHPDERLAVQETVRRGWIIGVPRLRDVLSRQLAVHG